MKSVIVFIFTVVVLLHSQDFQSNIVDFYYLMVCDSSCSDLYPARSRLVFSTVFNGNGYVGKDLVSIAGIENSVTFYTSGLDQYPLADGSYALVSTAWDDDGVTGKLVSGNGIVILRMGDSMFIFFDSQSLPRVKKAYQNIDALKYLSY